MQEITVQNQIQEWKKKTPLEIYTTGGIDKIIEEMKARVDGFKADVNTKEGRKKMRSKAREISSFKVALDDIGKSLVADWKKKSALVDENRKKMRDEFDALRDKIKKPAEDWDIQEKKRLEALNDALSILKHFVEYDYLASSGSTVDLIEKDYKQCELVISSTDWQELKPEAVELHKQASLKFNKVFALVREREKREAELAQLRAEKVERERVEREKELQRQQEEKARVEAEMIAAERVKQLEEEKRRLEQKIIDDAKRLEEEKRRAIENENLRKKQLEEEKQRAVEAERLRVKLEKEEIQRRKDLEKELQKNIDKVNHEVKQSLARLIFSLSEKESFIDSDKFDWFVDQLHQAIIDGKVQHVSILQT